MTRLRQLGDGAFILGAAACLALAQGCQPALQDFDGVPGVSIDEVEPFDGDRCQFLAIDTSQVGLDPGDPLLEQTPAFGDTPSRGRFLPLGPGDLPIGGDLDSPTLQLLPDLHPLSFLSFESLETPGELDDLPIPLRDSLIDRGEPLLEVPCPFAFEGIDRLL